MNMSDKKILLLIASIWFAVLILALAMNDLNSSFFVKLLFDDAKEFASRGTITPNFMPIGYSAFLGLCMRIGGESGIPACQTIVYLGALLVTFFFLKLGGASRLFLILGILVIALHPVLVLNIWRVHDGNLTVLLLLGFLASAVVFSRFRSKKIILAMGMLVGLLFTVRINTILLIFPALFLFLRVVYFGKKEFIKNAGIFLLSAVVFFSVINLAVKQKPLFFPDHGFYNFFSGTNEYAEKYLLKDYSGENSLGEALRARGYSVKTFEDWLNFPPEKYKELATEYIKNNPMDYLKLTGLKLITLFRPGYHVPERFEWISLDGLKRISKIILALPVFIWLFFVWKTRKRFFDRENLFVFLVVVLYTMPFLIANADPRYRFPLDTIFLADSFRRVSQITDAT